MSSPSSTSSTSSPPATPAAAVNIDLMQYCKDPSKYADQPENTRFYYDNLCKVVEQIRQENEQSGGARAGESFATFIRDLPYMMTVGMFTDPTQVTMLLLTDGLAATQGFWKNHARTVFVNASQYMAKWGYNWIARTGQLFPRAATGLTRFLFNSVALTRAMVYATNLTVNITTGVVRNTVRGFLALVGSRVFTGAMLALTTLMRAANIIFLAQMVMQVISMMVDAADPCNLNKALDADTMVAMTNEMNRTFKDNMIATETAFVTPDQEVHFVDQWPIPVKVEQLFPQRLRNAVDDTALKKARYEEFGMDEARAEALEDAHARFMFFYLGNLKYNAFGQPIDFPDKYDVPDLTPQTMDQMGERFVSFFANNNPVVARWIDKLAPILLLGIVAVLFLVFRFV